MIRLSNTTPIRDLRLALKMSQGQFAKKIGVDQANVSAMERRLPTLRTLARVLAKLGLEPVLWATPAVPSVLAQRRANADALHAKLRAELVPPEVAVSCGHQSGKATRFQAEIRALDAREAEELGAGQ